MNIIRNTITFLLLCLLIFPECTSAICIKNVQGEREHKHLLALKNVHIIPMTIPNKIIENATIVIKGNTIVSINAAIPDSAEIIDAKGKWLIPGLIDIHVHTLTDGHFNTNYPTRAAAIFTSVQDIMTPYIANGVTTIFDLNAMAGHFGQRNEILRGDVIGPRMALAAMINGGKGSGRIANSPSDGRQTARMIKAEGYEFVKVYSQLDEETFKAIVDESHKLGMKVVGHIPNSFSGKIDKAFVPHFGMIAHAEEFFKQTERDSVQDPKYLAQLAKKNGTWVSPTLIIITSALEQAHSLDGLSKMPSLQYVHPLLQNKWLTSNNYNKNATAESISRLERMVQFNNQLVKALKEEGVPIVAGTDAGSSGVVWGFSLHDEIALLVKAGLTEEEALLSATRLPATWLGIDDKIGTIEVGKFADLILLEANPLLDIHNTRKIAGVFVNGVWLSASKINTMLSELSKKNTDSKHKYEWKRRADY